MAAADDVVEGVLPIDKPAGPTSHDMVTRARRALGTRRVGHTGTLDPFASGLLLLCVGRATRIAEYISGMDKSYTAVIRLGAGTDTDDATGSVIAEHDTSGITLAAVERALDEQRGTILQTPPAYSAKKVKGERSYALAREGRAVELDPVTVTIRTMTITAFALPDVHVDVTCTSGTYIRAIARDLGASLGVGAHLTALRRTAIGSRTVAGAVDAAALQTDPDVVRAALVPTLDALDGMPRMELSPDDVVNVRHGRRLTVDSREGGDVIETQAGVTTVALTSAGELIAIADVDAGLIRPRKVFL